MQSLLNFSSTISESKDWAINRTTLDYILMDKSIGFAGPLIFLFTRENNNQDIFEAFDQHIDDETLKFGYKTLGEHIQFSIQIITLYCNSLEINTYKFDYIYIHSELYHERKRIYG